ncbi:MAG: carbamate kinase [Gemmatimonadetes bacterium]|nr:carbamate kinase [Gemmatimonadota bacterium]
MLIVTALGGNALLRRDEEMTAENQRANVRVACEALAAIAADNKLVVTHGNGPQVGLLDLWQTAYAPSTHFPFDVLGAETEGMIGYMIEQELGNLVPFERPIATLLTMIEVDPADPAFSAPSKFIGPRYGQEAATALRAEKGWVLKKDGEHWRRVVPSPDPRRIFELRPVRWLLDHDTIVIAAGGGGIPTMYQPGEERKLVGAECVIDKDLASGLLASELSADLFVMLTDADGVYVDWGQPTQRRIRRASPRAMERFDFAAGSMRPKVDAARRFVEATGRRAAIGALTDLPSIVRDEAGTSISGDEKDILFG